MLMLMQMQCNYGAKHLRCYRSQVSLVEVCVWCHHEGCVRSLSKMSLCLVVLGPILVGVPASPFIVLKGGLRLHLW
jgi:hypothetical protein